MLNFLWPIFIVISVISAFFSGNIFNINNAILKAGENTINLLLSLLGTICLWNGLMNILKNTSLIQKIKKIIFPLIHLLFPEINKNSKTYEYISMNIISNLLGLGNAATPAGIKALEEMQKSDLEKDTLSDSMGLLLVLNTASIQLIPTSIIAIRTSLGSTNPTQILIPVWGATILAAFVGVLFAKLLMKKI